MDAVAMNRELYHVAGSKYGDDGAHRWINLPSALKNAIKSDPSGERWTAVGMVATRLGALPNRGLIPGTPQLTKSQEADLAASGGQRMPTEFGDVWNRLIGTAVERVRTLEADGWMKEEIATAIRTSGCGVESGYRAIIDAGWSREDFCSCGIQGINAYCPIGEIYDNLANRA